MKTSRPTNNPKSLFDLRIIMRDEYVGKSWFMDNMSAPFWRIHYHIGDCGNLIHRGDSLRLKKGHVTVHAPYTSCRAEGSVNPNHLFIHFFPGFPFTLIRDRILQFPADGTLRLMMDKLRMNLSDCSGKGAAANLLTTGIVSEVLLETVGAFDFISDPDSRIETIDAFMAQNTEKSAGNDQLAGMLNMATNSFIRYFTQATGISPQKYFLQKKVERSAVFLEYYDMTIEEIASRCGFCDRYHLSKAFKQLTGISPAAYRQELARPRSGG